MGGGGGRGAGFDTPPATAIPYCNMSALLHAETEPLGLHRSPLPLENGDRLSSKEFLRRYEAMPETKKAELIEGVVTMGSPVSVGHAVADGMVQRWLGVYEAYTPGTQYLPNATVLLAPDNTVQPDALLRLLPERGGRTSVGSKGLVLGAPELVVEIAASSTSIDLHDKLRAYQRNQVLEYLVWLVAERQFKWFVLEDEAYVQLPPDSRGLVCSRVFPGLWLSVEALLALNPSAVLVALQKVLRSSAHKNF